MEKLRFEYMDIVINKLNNRVAYVYSYVPDNGIYLLRYSDGKLQREHEVNIAKYKKQLTLTSN